MCCSYYDRLLIMGDDMLIIAMNRLVIMHDQRHIHVIMNIIVNPTPTTVAAPVAPQNVGNIKHTFMGPLKTLISSVSDKQTN